MDLGVSGLASGFDWRGFIDQMISIERTPQSRMRSEQSSLRAANNAYGSLKNQLSALQAKIQALKSADLYQTRATRLSDPTAASASATTGATLGEYRFSVSQWATAASRQGAANVGASLSATDDVSTLALNAASFARPVTAGTFTVNGQQITLATTDTLQDVFDQISSATGGAVSASYSAATDAISLTSASPIVLGAASDTSNFLQAAKLSNNGTGNVTSRSALGTLQPGATLSQANLSTPITGGAAGAGEFKINGVSILYNASTDTLAAILTRINQSAAGVNAAYDAETDRLMLTNKTTGDVGMGLEDVTGNFLAATGLSGSSLQRGTDLHYSVNGSGTLVSRGNTITEESSGINGLSVSLLKAPGSGAPLEFTVHVEADTAKVKTALNDFINEYNKTQSLIDSQTAVTTAADGKVTASVLAGRSDVYELSSRLRSLANTTLSGFGGSLQRLNDLGVNSSGTDNSLRLAESGKLDDLLANQLSGVAQFFSDATAGFAVRLDTFLERSLGENGTLIQTQNNITKQVTGLDQQIEDQERHVQNVREQLMRSFLAMENAQALANQQLQFLMQRFSSSSK